jgi:hypothetical protein
MRLILHLRSFKGALKRGDQYASGWNPVSRSRDSNQLELTRSPRLVEPWLEGTVEAEQGEPCRDGGGGFGSVLRSTSW